MNCKQGDLARYVGVVGANYGRFVTIVAPFIHFDGIARWVVEPQLFIADGRKADAVRDSVLRPIRDPGDDAVDETLQRLPAPRETEPA